MLILVQRKCWTICKYKSCDQSRSSSIYDALSMRHRWLTGGTTEEFYNQNYPAGIAKRLQMQRIY
jgi:hypothetical protein